MVYREAGQGGTLYTMLPYQHKRRRKQRRYGAGRGLIPDRVSIDVRPAVVAKRRRFGDWEGDTVEGAKGTGLITTHVERMSRYLIAAKLPYKQAKTAAETITKAYMCVPRKFRKTLTLDNGKEFARFKFIQEKN